LLQETRPIVQELIQWETRNGESLARQMAAARARQAELGTGKENLRRIKSSYLATAVAQWQSYS
jgi:hypothetical protein